MYIQTDQARELYRSSVSRIHGSLHEHLAFVIKLTEGDDWSFVIKVQALIEDSVSRAVLTQLGEHRIRKTVELLPLVGDNASKLRLAKDLNILNATQRKFVKHLATLRNRLAHRVDCVDFTFNKYIESLDRDGTRDWQDSIIWFCSDHLEARNQWRKLSLIQPRSAVVMACFQLVAMMAVDNNEADLKRAIDAASVEAMAQLLSVKVERD